MRRREVLYGIGATPLWWSIARAENASPRIVGVLSSRSADEAAPHAKALREGLAATGNTDGQNINLLFRWADGDYRRLPGLAREIVEAGTRLMIATGGTAPALAAQAATRLPIVFLIGEDPVGIGLVRSFNRPGGNITGFTFLTSELGGKRLGLLLELVPRARTVAILVNPDNATAHAQIDDVQRTADTLGRQLKIFRAAARDDVDPAFASMAEQKIQGLVVANDPFFDSQRDRLMALAAKIRLPAIYHIREFPAAGGLMSYGASLVDAYREVGKYAGRILNGEQPSDLPVLQPTRFELIINLTTAKALELDVPATLLARADDVIE